MHIETVALEGGLRYIAHHASINDMLVLVDDAEDDAKKKGDRNNRGYYPDLTGDWSHGRLNTYDATRNCLRFAQVPSYVTEKAERFREKLMASDAYRMASERAASTKRRRVFEIEGAELDIDRYLGAQEECWGRVTRGLQRPVVRMGINFMAQAGNNEEHFAGVAALGCCCALLAEQAGCSLEIKALTFTQHTELSGLRVAEGGMCVTIKQAEEPFHQDSLLMCGIPGYFRFYGVHAAALGTKGHGHGGAHAMSKQLKKHLGLQHVLEVAWTDAGQKVFLDDFVKTLHDA